MSGSPETLSTVTCSTAVILVGRDNAIRYFLQGEQSVHSAEIVVPVEPPEDEQTASHHQMLVTAKSAVKQLAEELTDPDLLWLSINPKVEAAFLHNLGRFALGQLYTQAQKKAIGGKGYPTQFVEVLWQRTATERRWLVLTVRDPSLETRVSQLGLAQGKDAYFYLDHADVRYMVYRMKPEDNAEELFKLFWELAQQTGMYDESLPNLHVNKDGRLPLLLNAEILHTTLTPAISEDVKELPKIL